MERRARDALAADLASGEPSDTKFYRAHCFETLDPGTLERLFGAADARAVSDARFLEALVLHRLLVSPYEREHTVRFEYRTGSQPDRRCYATFVVFAAAGNLEEVAVEDRFDADSEKRRHGARSWIRGFLRRWF